MGMLSKILDKYSKDTAIVVNVQSFETPLGIIYAAADEEYLYTITFEDSKNFEKIFDLVYKETTCRYVDKSNKILETLKQELEGYFAGKLKQFTVPIKTFGSDFQKEVWDRLLQVPYGATQTYGELAKSMGRKASHARAIGAACGANSHLIVIPCHRLIASCVSSGGYSGGLDRKQLLLDHEKKHTTTNKRLR